MALSAGCFPAARNIEVSPNAEIPVAPTEPFDHGCSTIQSSTSAPSATISSTKIDVFDPNEAPAPLISTSTWANPRRANASPQSTSSWFARLIAVSNPGMR